jgi:hypothetical protein
MLADCMLSRMNIRDWFTRSHPSKVENRNRNRSKSCKCKRALPKSEDFFDIEVHYLPISFDNLGIFRAREFSS